jgi:hypothetical protein
MIPQFGTQEFSNWATENSIVIKGVILFLILLSGLAHQKTRKNTSKVLGLFVAGILLAIPVGLFLLVLVKISILLAASALGLVIYLVLIIVRKVMGAATMKSNDMSISQSYAVFRQRLNTPGKRLMFKALILMFILPFFAVWLAAMIYMRH